jgi:signal transduction histidine kinase
LRTPSTQITQVFQNLIANAIKFTNGGAPLIRVAARKEPNRWVISVQDNGIGIAPEHGKRIFQLFERLHTRGEYPGTGIGLAICQRIIERHQGMIWVDSQLGQGATFYFALPDSPPPLNQPPI